MDYCIRSIGTVICELRENDEHGNVADASPQVEAEMAHELSYTIGDEPSFTYFINELRHILSDHENSADICDGRSNEEQNHPLLSKPRADQQPSRWIRIKLLHVVKGKKQTETTTSITLVMRDDNVDVVGFINNNGAYELGYRRTMVLPAEADAEPNSSVVLLGWGNSYKSILGVRTEEEAMDRLTSANLGKAFATAAVDALSRFDPNEVADGDNPRLQVVGLMFMVSESARLNHVHDTIARGWVNGNGFKKKLMTDHVWKYVEMSRRLRHWKGGGYAKRRPDEELRDIYLVLNEEHDLLSSDLLSFACPETLKASFPDMMKVRFLAKVVVTLQLPRNKSQHMGRVCGKIAALIREKHRNSAYFRVGSVLCIEGNSSNPMAQASSVVAVPSGWVLHIEVDLHIKTSNSDKDMKHLKFITPMFDNDNKTGTQRSEIYEGVEVEVKITHEERADFRPQLTCPVEVEMESGYLTLAYTIGDEMSFTEFIMALRRILADHPYREELLDGHDFLNLSSSREHPVLARHRPVLGPARWLLIKLRVVEGSKTWSTTLMLRDDDLYVHGFRNDSQGVWYELRDTEMRHRDQHAPQLYANTGIFPTTLNPHQKLYWGVSYRSILDSSPVPRLASKALGRNFATDAVRRLSSSLPPEDRETDGLISARLALAGLILMVCESARFNPVHDFFVQGWNEGTRWRMELMEDYVWKYRDMSMKLLTWKTKGYAARHPIQQLQDICLVLNTNRTRGGNPPDDGHQQLKPVAGNTGSGGGRRGPSHDDTGGGGAGKRRRVTKDGSSGSTQGHKRNKPNTAGSSGGRGRKSEHTSAADSEGSPDGRQSEESSDAGSPGESDHSEESSDDSGSSGGNSSGQPGGAEADHDTQCLGRPLVELLSMRGKLGAKGTKITVFDGKRGQIIYAEEEQERELQGKMVDFLLTGPYKGISAYGCFAIVIDIPGDTAAGSSSGVAGGSIQWEWDCYDPEYAKELDQGPVTHTIGDVAEVTYAVMSNAREATVVRFKLRLKDGHTPSCVGGGKITALIDDFEARSVLFKHGQGMGQCLSPTDDGSWFLLQLARNVVAVPCRSTLHIQVDLQIVTEDGNQVPLNVCLSLDNGICSSNKSKTDNGNEVQVEVTWYPEITRPDKTREEIDQPDLKLSAEARPPDQIATKEDEEKFITAPSEQSGPVEVKMVSGHHPTVVYTIGDVLSFIGFIMELRGILADHPDSEDIFDGHHSSILSSSREHPVLAKQRAEQPARWIHVKLQLVDGEETLSTTLLMRDDNLYVCGFINQQGTVYELVENLDRSAHILPVDEYNPRRLSWGVGYRSLLDADTEDELVRILARMNMGRDFAMDAVHVLSRFPAWVDNHIRMNPRLALAGLIVMVCESARMKPIYDFFRRSSWSSSNKLTDRGSTEDLMRGYVMKINGYGRMSRELLAWKSERYAYPHPNRQVQDIYLVLNYCLDPSHQASGAESSSSSSHGRPRVELLAIRADLRFVGLQTVTVFDGKRGHIIYRKEDQEEKGQMTNDLVLTGPYTSISAYGCFAIIIEIPPPGAAAVGSRKGDGSGSIIWKWDCYDKKYAEEVDKGPRTRTIRSPSGPGRGVEVTYAVMSNALEATVQVKMRRKDGNSSCSVHGEINARIGNFSEESILFRRTQETAQHFSSTESRVLQLTRNVVAVPCGQKLHIELDLSIETSKNQGVSNSMYLDLFSFNSGEDIGSSQWSPEGDDGQFEVTVSWYPSKRSSRPMEIEMSWEPDISYIVGDDAEGFNRFVTELRTLVAEQPGCKDLMADHPELSSTSNNHPVLPKVRYMKPAERLFRIKLEVVDVNKTSWITLVMRGDNLDVIGFINKDGVCYELGNPGSDQQLPRGYQPKFLGWEGVDEAEEVGPAKLGKDFVKIAVQYLSGYAVVGPPNSAKRSLFGLKITICDSARMEPVREAIAAGWNKGETAVDKHLQNCIRMWRPVSRALLDWKDRGYEGLTKLVSEAARKTVPLVLNDYDRI